MPKQSKAKRHGTRTHKRNQQKLVLTGGSGVTWTEFFMGKRFTRRRISNRHRKHSKKQ